MFPQILHSAFGSGGKEPVAPAETPEPGGAPCGSVASVDGWLCKGIALAGVDRHEEALAAYERALACLPDHLMTWYQKGVSLAALKRTTEALEAYEYALAIDPDFFLAWHGKAIALAGIDRTGEALAAFERARATGPDDSGSWFH